MDRFFDKIDMRGDDECWPWTAGTDGHGYGRFYVEGRSAVYAHRFAWELLVHVPADASVHVLHSCDNPPCCNPAHLREGSPGDNSKDRVDRNRQARGESIGTSKLTEADVLEIRQRWEWDDVTQRDLAAQFGVYPGHISRIVNRERWGHV